jgi:predicted dithiol-disulfide oxidoreductase (DUF899 family)
MPPMKTDPDWLEKFRAHYADWWSEARPIRLSQLFGSKKDLFVIHNMGSSCPYCTLWADGYNGLYGHIASRAAFFISSPDPPTVQRRFARGRGWRFPMVSHEGTSFAQDMGYRSRSGGWLPGISAFRREGGRIVRVSDAGSSPGDDFCALWHVLDLLPHGSAGSRTSAIAEPGARAEARRVMGWRASPQRCVDATRRSTR